MSWLSSSSSPHHAPRYLHHLGSRLQYLHFIWWPGTSLSHNWFLHVLLSSVKNHFTKTLAYLSFSYRFSSFFRLRRSLSKLSSVNMVTSLNFIFKLLVIPWSKRLIKDAQLPSRWHICCKSIAFIFLIYQWWEECQTNKKLWAYAHHGS